MTDTQQAASAAFIAGRNEVFTALKTIIAHDYNRHAPHGIWHYCPPMDEPMEMESMARTMGQDIVKHIHDALDALAEGYSLNQVTGKMHIPEYVPALDGGAAEGRAAALNDFRFLLLMMNLPGIAAQSFHRDGHVISEENHEAARFGLNKYTMTMLAQFIQDSVDMEKQLTRQNKLPKPRPIEHHKKQQNKKQRSFKGALRAAWNYMLAPAGQKQRESTAARLFRELPKAWPPVRRTASQPPAFGKPQHSAAPANPPHAMAPPPQQACYTDGVENGLRAFFYGLQKLHFQYLAEDGYVPIMPTDGTKSRQASRLMDELFDSVRQEILKLLREQGVTHLNTPSSRTHGDYHDEVQRALTLARQALEKMNTHPKYPRDKTLVSFAENLAGYWTNHIDTIARQMLNGTYTQYTPPRTRHLRQKSIRQKKGPHI